jgi:hypothetical protein
MNTLSVALQMFFINNKQFPTHPDGGDTLAEAAVKIGQGSDARYISLLTPVSYIVRLPKDPFNQEKPSYRYLSNGSWYIIISNGPDGDEDIDISSIKSNIDDFSKIQTEIEKFKYDPSTGNGDMIKIRH